MLPRDRRRQHADRARRVRRHRRCCSTGASRPTRGAPRTSTACWSAACWPAPAVRPTSAASRSSASVPAMNATIDRRCAASYLGLEPLVVGPGVRTGMPILYDKPQEVGADRIVNAIAAYERTRDTTIVVDFGTRDDASTTSRSKRRVRRRRHRARASASPARRCSSAPPSSTSRAGEAEARWSGATPCTPCSRASIYGHVALVDGLVDAHPAREQGQGAGHRHRRLRAVAGAGVGDHRGGGRVPDPGRACG